MKRISVSLTEKQIENMKGISSDSGISVSEHIRRAIDAYIKFYYREKKEFPA
jgi:metal-responsive CopG/Arc/MetJ family transcriptional regulator